MRIWKKSHKITAKIGLGRRDGDDGEGEEDNEDRKTKTKSMKSPLASDDKRGIRAGQDKARCSDDQQEGE